MGCEHFGVEKEELRAVRGPEPRRLAIVDAIWRQTNVRQDWIDRGAAGDAQRRQRIAAVADRPQRFGGETREGEMEELDKELKNCWLTTESKLHLQNTRELLRIYSELICKAINL